MRLDDREEIRARLSTDRPWAVYALGDLTPRLFGQTAWYANAERPPALAMVYHGFEPHVLFALGPADSVAPLLDEIGAEKPLYLHTPAHILPLIQQRFQVTWHKGMRRMLWRPDDAGDHESEGTVRLGPADLDAVQKLYADGDAAGEAPDFFAASMLEEGVFFGIVEGRELVAAAGTHLVAQAEGVAAVGNIYTRRDRRGQGLAHRCTAAVVRALRELRIPTIALNVHEKNASAIRVYEDLGFVHYCDFIEGLALPHSGETL